MQPRVIVSVISLLTAVRMRLFTHYHTKKAPSSGASDFKMAGIEGFEPSLTAPKTAVLPLDDIPVLLLALCFALVLLLC